MAGDEVPWWIQTGGWRGARSLRLEMDARSVQSDRSNDTAGSSTVERDMLTKLRGEARAADLTPQRRGALGSPRRPKPSREQREAYLRGKGIIK